MQNNENREFPKLTSSRLLLDPLTMKDAKDVFAIFSDPRVIKNYDVQIFKDISEAEGLIDYFYRRFESDTGIRWAIRNKQTGELIGSCGFNTWNPYDHCAVVGYELAPQFWGKGYASEAVSAILDFIFAKSFYFYVNRVEALILPQNKPSAQLVKKLGFALDGVMRGKTYWNDDFHDIAMYSMLNKQWHAR